ncbi:MAG: DUF1501 domain-containing protein, partial [Planctomycetales bacterium]|nr:DUF1501 domain-containing protein [Planctomycetales bacterium]
MKHRQLCTPREHALSRRRWLGAAAAGVGGACGAGFFQPQLLAEELARRQKQVLFLWLDGGISQLESWDPKPNTEFGGPFRAIPTAVTGVHISELMPKSAAQMHRLALVRSLQTKDQDHSSGVERIQRGDPANRGVDYPLLGSAVTRLLPPSDSGMPPYVVIKPGGGGFFHKDAGFLGAKFGAVAFGDGQPPPNMTANADLQPQDVRERAELLARHEAAFAATHP